MLWRLWAGLGLAPFVRECSASNNEIQFPLLDHYLRGCCGCPIDHANPACIDTISTARLRAAIRQSLDAFVQLKDSIANQFTAERYGKRASVVTDPNQVWKYLEP